MSRHLLIGVTLYLLSGALLADAGEFQACDSELQEFDDDPARSCAPGIPLNYDFHATPLMDGNTGLYWPTGSMTGNTQIVTLYGVYGNNEQNVSQPAALAHYNKGISEGALIQPLNLNGQPDPNGSIVFLFIGFSNCDIEVCGGNKDIWENPNKPRLTGQPCSTTCKNPVKSPIAGYAPWNDALDGVTQQSVLYQVYHPGPRLVGSHVYLFDGALGNQLLSKWDPNGFYTGNDCNYDGVPTHDPECNYDRIKLALIANGFSENQVQAVFVKTSNAYPKCDLSGQHCLTGVTEPDAYTSERTLGNIVRYFKCCKAEGTARYPNIHQVFITSRIYGGYPTTQAHGCLMPEPFAYEEGFAVQRLIVAQINQTYGVLTSEPYSGSLGYGNAPWIEWGPYLWADRDHPRSDGLIWCSGQGGICSGRRDFRFGDLSDPVDRWGDLTHPSAQGTEKVAGKIVQFLNSPTSFVHGWIQK